MTGYLENTGCVAFLLVMQQVVAQSLVQYVQPLSGTAPSTTTAAIKHSEAGGTEKNANTIPAVTLAFCHDTMDAANKNYRNKMPATLLL